MNNLYSNINLGENIKKQFNDMVVENFVLREALSQISAQCEFWCPTGTTKAYDETSEKLQTIKNVADKAFERIKEI